jgi:hypothetical protein
MHRAFNPHLTAGVALAGASAIAIAQLPAPLMNASLPNVAVAANS